MQETKQGSKNTVTCERIFGDINQRVIIVLWRGKMSMKKVIGGVVAAATLAAVMYAGWWLWENYPRDYWVTKSSGVVHNYHCQHYAKSNGYMSSDPVGPDCKKCGGRIK